MSGEGNGGLDLSSVIGKLTENPDALRSAIATVSAAMEKGDGGGDSADTSAKPPSIDPDTGAKLLPVLSTLGGSGVPKASHNPKSNPRCELLRALKPFLSPSRCEAVDYLIKLDGLGGLFNGLKG